jgi:hypothetical protein
MIELVVERTDESSMTGGIIMKECGTAMSKIVISKRGV